MARLAALGTPVMVIAQYDRLHWTASPERQSGERRLARDALACASNAGLGVLDTAESLKKEIEARGLDALYRTNHHSDEGDRFVARLIQQSL